MVTVGGVTSNGVSFTVSLICGETGQSGTDNENSDWAFAHPALQEAIECEWIYTSFDSVLGGKCYLNVVRSWNLCRQFKHSR